MQTRLRHTHARFLQDCISVIAIVDGMYEETCINNDHLSSTARNDFLQKSGHHQESGQQRAFTNLEVGGMSDNQPPDPNFLHHRVCPITEPTFYTLVLIQRPTAVPQWSVVPVQSILLLCYRLW